ncbi:hypothetical protein [Saccharothrix variisporea]|uniref:Uncharacterized protein n=1 Tax=Saccharothrix variisporea TaxID=543527 RepID=A0A495XIQ1_9PSEU|nr:hypothetical protein [Saccharothrix variisporea]RKT74371.1 hypothetical protein DFJ66_7716 [Saccharothrix variisporea]
MLVIAEVNAGMTRSDEVPKESTVFDCEVNRAIADNPATLTDFPRSFYRTPQ